MSLQKYVHLCEQLNAQRCHVAERIKITSKSKPLELIRPATKVELAVLIKEEVNKQGPDADLNFIDTSLITDMSYLFGVGGFSIGNIKIDQWDVSNVKNMSYMFISCRKLNCDLSSWNVRNLKITAYMFYDCPNFNCDLSDWDVSNVTNMENMFNKCTKFKSDLSGWDVSNVIYKAGMFVSCPKMRKNPQLQPNFKN
jgi:surface protein